MDVLFKHSKILKASTPNHETERMAYKPMTLVALANAKINLFLDISAHRKDGYHDIVSIMQSVDLCDTLTIEYNDSEKFEINITCDNSSIPTDDSNLVYRAAQKLIDRGILNINIEKKIPMSAGLAGGSADAAATLVALNYILGNPKTISELKTIGATIGADIPFCIEGGTQLVKGIGDVMMPIPSMPHVPLVIARLGEGMSTPVAYKALDEKYDNFTNYDICHSKLNRLMLDIPTTASEYASGIYNVFESVVEPIRPSVAFVKNTMTSCGALNTVMSGSGTSVFGIFENEDDAKNAVAQLISVGAIAHLSYPAGNGITIKKSQ